MGANTNWKASDEESGSRLRLKAVWETDRQLMYPDARQKHSGTWNAALSYSFTSFSFSRKNPGIAHSKKAVQGHDGILRALCSKYPALLQRYPNIRLQV